MDIMKRLLRAIVHVVAVDAESVTFSVPRWAESATVKRPLSAFPAAYRSMFAENATLTASVNTEAKNADDLMFSDFEVAPEDMHQQILEQLASGPKTAIELYIAIKDDVVLMTFDLFDLVEQKKVRLTYHAKDRGGNIDPTEHETPLTVPKESYDVAQVFTLA